MGPFAVVGADGSSSWKVAPWPRRRFHPDAAAVHLDNLLGDGKSEAGTALGLGVGVVHLVELLEDARLLLRGNARPRVGHATAKWPFSRRRGDAHLAGVGELDGVADQVEQHLRQTLLVAEADRQALAQRRS